MPDKELSMDISMINFEMPKKWKIELMLKKARDCLEQLKQLESQLEKMEAPRSFEAGHYKFIEYWKVSKEIDKLYAWMKNVELSNYPMTSKGDLIGYIEFWEIKLKELENA